MKRVAIIAMLLAGCAPQPDPALGSGMAVADNMADASAGALHSDGGEMMTTCVGSQADRLLGRIVDPALRTEAKRLTRADAVRVIPPGAMVTMDYRGNRLNIDTDAAHRATRFHCG